MTTIRELQLELRAVSAIIEAQQTVPWTGSDQQRQAEQAAMDRHFEIRNQIMRRRMARRKVTDRGMLEEGFAYLRKQGYRAETDFTCCPSCGHRAMQPAQNYVFWHGQAEDMSFDGGYDLVDSIFLNWSGDPKPIVATLQAVGFGLRVQHDGDPSRTIEVQKRG